MEESLQNLQDRYQRVQLEMAALTEEKVSRERERDEYIELLEREREVRAQRDVEYQEVMNSLFIFWNFHCERLTFTLTQELSSLQKSHESALAESEERVLNLELEVQEAQLNLKRQMAKAQEMLSRVRCVSFFFLSLHL